MTETFAKLSRTTCSPFDVASGAQNTLTSNPTRLDYETSAFLSEIIIAQSPLWLDRPGWRYWACW